MDTTDTESFTRFTGRLNRRRLLQMAAGAGALVPLSALLAACGGDDEGEPAATATTAPGGTSAPAPTPTRAAAATVDASPVTAASPGTGTSGQAGGTPKPGGTLQFSYRNVVNDTLNQHISNHTQSRMLARHVLDCLTYVDTKSGEVTPWLAESWEVSGDGLQVTLKLLKGPKFHDGTEFNAEAVKKNFDYTMDPNTKHGFTYSALGADKYDRTEVVDAATVRVHFKRPHGTFLLFLSDGGTGIDSPTAMEQAGQDYGIKSLVGTGAYKFVEWVQKDHVTMQKNPDYNWGPKMAGHQGPAYLDTIIWREIPENATRAAALQNGDIDMAQLVESQVAQFQGSKDVSIILIPKAGTTRMFLMNAAKEPLVDIKVRQAINHAVDKAALIKLPAWAGIGRPAIAPLPANMVPNSDLSSLKQYDLPYDQNKAKQLLDEAGWRMGSGDVRTKDGQELTLDMIISQNDVGQAEPFAGMLNQVGIKVNIKPGDFNYWIDTVHKKEFHLTIHSDSGYVAPGLIEEYFYSSAVYNDWGVSDPEIDKAIETAVGTADPKVRWDNLMRAMGLILQKVPGVMGWEQDYVFGASNKVKNPGFNEVGYGYLYDTWLES